MVSTPLEEIQRRISSLQSLMTEQGFDGALVVEQADLFYLSGTGQDAHLFVPAQGPAVLMVRKNFDRARDESPLQHVHAVKNLKDLKAIVDSAASSPLKTLGMELDVLPVNNFRQYEQAFAPSTIADVSPLIKTVRMVKSAYEMALIKQAATLNNSMFALAREVLKEGMTELEFSSVLEAFYRTTWSSGACAGEELQPGGILRPRPVRIQPGGSELFRGTDRRTGTSSFISSRRGTQEDRPARAGPGGLRGHRRRVHGGPGADVLSRRPT